MEITAGKYAIDENVTLASISGVCADILKELRTHSAEHGACVVALSGPIGAGKTTFSQTFARILGVKETVQSPTFVIEKRYATTDSQFSHLVHIDAYRLEAPEELEILRFSETKKSPHTLVLLEWAENVYALLPEKTFWIALSHVEGETRHIRAGWQQNNGMAT